MGACDYCGRPFVDGDEVVLEQPGEIVGGKFMPTDEPRLHHDDCGEEDY